MRRAPNVNPKKKKKVFYGNFRKFKSIEEIIKKTSFIFIFVQFILTAIGKRQKV